jgi:hypothetical protein
MQIAGLADSRSQRGRHTPPQQHGLTTIAALDMRCVPTRSDSAFRSLLEASRDSGGLAHADEVTTLLERRCGVDGGRLRRWRLERRVVAFGWQSHTWLPRFQFELAGLPPAPGVSAVLAVLRTVFDDWQSAWWFVRPHPALNDHAPALVIADDLAAVLATARGDRFVARVESGVTPAC